MARTIVILGNGYSTHDGDFEEFCNSGGELVAGMYADKDGLERAKAEADLIICGNYYGDPALGTKYYVQGEFTFALTEKEMAEIRQRNND